jgi:hypothetical protein
VEPFEELVRAYVDPLIEAEEWAVIKRALDDPSGTATEILDDDATFTLRQDVIHVLDSNRGQFAAFLREEDPDAYRELFDAPINGSIPGATSGATSRIPSATSGATSGASATSHSRREEKAIRVPSPHRTHTKLHHESGGTGVREKRQSEHSRSSQDEKLRFIAEMQNAGRSDWETRELFMARFGASRRTYYNQKARLAWLNRSEEDAG